MQSLRSQRLKQWRKARSPCFDFQDPSCGNSLFFSKSSGKARSFSENDFPEDWLYRCDVTGILYANRRFAKMTAMPDELTETPE
ncbi:MAG TPA: hypothetical protein VFZ35_01115 [Sphingomicrobium sp.]